MAKRFTDSEKWNDAWFMDLPSKYKLLWLYLLDSCDHAGIWKVNFKVACFAIGENLEPSEVKRILSGRINFINDEYWQVIKFIEFQYGGLKNDQVGRSVSKILEKHGLLADCEGLPRGYQAPKDKDKVLAKDILVYGQKSNLSFAVSKKYVDDRACKVYDSGFKEYAEIHQMGYWFAKPYLVELFWKEWNGKLFNDHKHVNNVMLKINNSNG